MNLVKKLIPSLLMLPVIWMAACNNPATENTGKQNIDSLNFDADNGGLQLPAGFKAVVVAKDIGPARHIAVRDNGDLYVGLNNTDKGGGIAALEDKDGDGKADSIVYFGAGSGTGVAIHKGYLYHAQDTAIIRYRLIDGSLLPDTSKPETIALLPVQHEHQMKTVAFDNSGNMYVNIGAPSNACQVEDRTKGSPGQMPCPLLENHAGIWQFSDSKLNQSEENGGKRYASGLRNTEALAWNSSTNHLYGAMNGRDQLFQLYPQYYSAEQGADLPAEEFMEINEGDNFGWPYVYYDQNKQQLMQCPEYGGDGKKTAAEGKYKDPLMGFPGHWAPLGLVFYTGDQFPSQYKNGAFIAFHGSWNRAPQPQAPSRVMFVPFNNDKLAGDSVVFAGNLAGVDSLQSPGDAKHRAVGLAQGPDGSLYITDDAKGYIWRVVYTGKN